MGGIKEALWCDLDTGRCEEAKCGKTSLSASSFPLRCRHSGISLNQKDKGQGCSIICNSSGTGNMQTLYMSVLLCFLLLGSLPSTGAEESKREKRSLPYWGLWSSDFFGWLEELRAQAAENGMQDLARTFWAHFPISRELGYESPETDHQSEE